MSRVIKEELIETDSDKSGTGYRAYNMMTCHIHEIQIEGLDNNRITSIRVGATEYLPDEVGLVSLNELLPIRWNSNEVFRMITDRAQTLGVRLLVKYDVEPENPLAAHMKLRKGELIFILRAQDQLAPEMVREWAYRALKAGAPRDKVVEARQIADAMEDWQVENSRKVPD